MSCWETNTQTSYSISMFLMLLQQIKDVMMIAGGRVAINEEYEGDEEDKDEEQGSRKRRRTATRKKRRGTR